MESKDIQKIVYDEEDIFGKSLGEDFLKKELENPIARYFVIEDQLLIGYIGLRVLGDNAEVLNLYIEKKNQGRGYGCKLFSYAINRLKEENVKSLSLEVRKSNLRAINMYEKFGLKACYERKNYYQDNEDAILMIGVI